MFGLFKKETLNSGQRFYHIISNIEKNIRKTIKSTTGDLRFLERDISEDLNQDRINEFISQITTQKIGFAILSLNLGIRKVHNQEPLIYETFKIWEENIQNKSIKVCSFVSVELQQEIYNRFLLYQTDLQFGYIGNQSVGKFFENTFETETICYTKHYSLNPTDKFIRLTKNEFLNEFSFFDRYFSKFNHI